MTKLYLIRHAEAEGNLYRRIHGHYNSRITENGFLQIAALQARFRDIHIDAVYASDLIRTMETAKAIYLPKNLPLITCPDLREISVGIWEDRTWGEVDRLNHEEMRLFCDSSPKWHIEGGETFQDVRNRVSAAILAIAAKHPNQTVALFSHGTAMRHAMAALKGLSLEESTSLGHSDNTAVSLLEIEDGMVHFAFQDDNSHLSHEISTLARQSWWKSASNSSPDENLWYKPMELSKPIDRALYVAARKNAWSGLYGSERAFDAQSFLADAKANQKIHPKFVLHTMCRDEKIGILQMNPSYDPSLQAGYISFLYMNPDYRRKGLGVQLLGQAISTYRPMGKTRLHLACSPKNLTAQHFYARNGFRKISETKGAFGPLDLMEKSIE